MAIDLEALASFQTETSLDGLADLVFWGEDAAAIAERTGATEGASPTDPGAYAFVGIPIAEAQRHAAAVVKMAEEGRLEVELDLRPHSHLFLLVSSATASSTSAATLDVAGTRACGFLTPDEGAFSVTIDRAGDGTLLAARIGLR
jgi:hypothetical protein